MRLGPVVAQGVLIGYGDYNADTGPINVLAVSGAGTVTTLLADFATEQVGFANPVGPSLCGYRALNDGVIWTPSVDPRGSTAASLATNLGDVWRTVSVDLPGVAVVEHLFDVAQESNGDLYVSGSHAPDTAFVARSTNLGSSWTEVLTYATGQADGFNRFYSLRRKGGALAVTSSHHGGYYVRQVDGSWPFTAGFTTFDTEPSLLVTSDGTTRLEVPGRGVLGSFPDTKTVTYTEVGDGSIWLCDGDAIYLLPPPD